MVREPLDDERRRLLTAIASNPAMTRLDGGLVAVVLTLVPVVGCVGLSGGPVGSVVALAVIVGLVALPFHDRARWRRAIVGCLAEEAADRRLGDVDLPSVDAPRDARWPLICDLLRRTAASDVGDGRLRRSCEILQHALAGRLAEVARLSQAEAFEARFDAEGTGHAATRLREARCEAEERLETLLDAARRLHAEAMAAERGDDAASDVVQSELARLSASRETEAVARRRLGTARAADQRLTGRSWR